MRRSFSTTSTSMLALILTALLLHGSPAKADDDPLEAFNREIFAFNNKIDQMILRPVTVAYVDHTPEPVQTGVSNVVNNFRDVTNAVNALLQFRLLDAASSTSRVLINTTLGVGGILDPASDFGIERSYADFGQTLASWGVPEGPFLMLPLLGPSTFRAGAGTAVDAMSLSVQAQLETPGQLGYWTASTIDTRAQLLGVDSLLTGDQYIFLREAYLQNRRALNGDSAPSDDFGSFDEDFDELDELSDF